MIVTANTGFFRLAPARSEEHIGQVTYCRRASKLLRRIPASRMASLARSLIISLDLADGGGDAKAVGGRLGLRAGRAPHAAVLGGHVGVALR